jgi:hypothetical protein
MHEVCVHRDMNSKPRPRPAGGFVTLVAPAVWLGGPAVPRTETRPPRPGLTRPDQGWYHASSHTSNSELQLFRRTCPREGLHAPRRAHPITI